MQTYICRRQQHSKFNGNRRITAIKHGTRLRVAGVFGGYPPKYHGSSTLLSLTLRRCVLYSSQDPREDADDPRKKRDPQGSLLDPAISDKDLFTEVCIACIVE